MRGEIGLMMATRVLQNETQDMLNLVPKRSDAGKGRALQKKAPPSRTAKHIYKSNNLPTHTDSGKEAKCTTRWREHQVWVTDIIEFTIERPAVCGLAYNECMEQADTS